jgi:hypothetical protein
MKLAYRRQLCCASLACAVAAPSQGQIARPIAVHHIAESRNRTDTVLDIDPVRTRAATPDTASADDPVNYAGGIAGGLVGAMLGSVAGGVAGAAAANGCHGEECGLGSTLVGIFVGQAIGTGLGTHIGSGSHGNGALSTVASVSMMAATARSTGVFLALPLQIAAVLAIERATSQGR